MRKFNFRLKHFLVALFALIFVSSTAGLCVINAKADTADVVSTVIVNDTVRVQALSDTLVRIEVKGPKGFEDRETYYVVNRTNWEKVDTTVTTEDNMTAIATAAYTVYVPSNASDLTGVYIVDNKTGEKVWEYMGETTGNVYLPSASDELACWYLSDSPRVVPSDLGYSIDKNNEYGELQGWDYDNDATDMYVFLPQGSYKQFMKDYTSLTGSAEMVELQTLGYWDSRWYAYSAETALDQIHEYLDRGYCIDVLVIDTDWRDASQGWGYDINTSLFPNMAKFLEDCEKLGIEITFNDHPEPVNGTQNGLEENEVEYRNKNLTLLLSLGLDYWWYDRNWGVCLKPFDQEVSVFAFGMYCYQWITKDYLESITDIGEYAKRALIMGNVDGCLHGAWKYASDVSAHRYSIQWTGDIGTDSTALAQEIYATIFGGVEVGIPYMSSDIGGHTAPVTDSMYVRWTQYGALSPIYRVHCTSTANIGQDGRMPWLFGERAENVAKTYVQMRYRLLPLYYNLAHEAYSEGLPLVRRLDILYPQYVESARNDEYLLGENILVAPIAEAELSNIVPEDWLSYNDNGQTVSGLKGEYFFSKDLRGTPQVKNDKTIDFNWGTGGPVGFGSDNYSMRWSGKINFKKNARLAFFADDGIRVKIDGSVVVDGWTVYDKVLTTPYYAEGDTHDIEIEYFEAGGNAHVYMYYQEYDENDNSYNTREVFLPEGTWIDVWSGEKFTGPKTIEVTHSLDTSPIFVREGSIVALAENMQQTSEKDWHNMTLDVYPSKNYTSSQTIYEDDTKTVGYKDGVYRTTLVESGYNADQDAIVVKMNPAQGKFDGALAFEKRNWKVRIHAYEEWGRVTKVTVNGKEVKALHYAKDKTAQPFARSGGALDFDVYEVEFSGNIYENCEVLVWFENIQETAKNEEYDTTAVEFDAQLMGANDYVNLTEEGDIDWTYFGRVDATSVDEKLEGNSSFGNIKGFENNIISFYDCPTTFSWTNGNNGSVAGTTNGIVNSKDFTFTANTVGYEAYYTIYVTCYKATAKLTIRDRAGNVETVIFGNMEGNYTGRVVVHVKSTETTQLYFTLATLSVKHDNATSTGGCASNVALNAMLIGSSVKPTEQVVEVPVTVTLKSMQTAVGTVNLTDNGKDLGMRTVDWAYNAAYGGTTRISKDGANNITNTVFSEDGGTGRAFDDFNASFTWTDGNPVASSGGTTKGYCGDGQTKFSVKINPETKYLRLYTGVWNSTNKISIYNRQNKLLCTSDAFSANSPSVCKVVTFELSAEAETTINVVVESINSHDGGNISLPAITLLAPVEPESVQPTDAPASVNLTTCGSDLSTKVIDWYYRGEGYNGVGKNGGEAIKSVSYGGDTSISLTTYTSVMSWTDGDTEAEASGLNSVYGVSGKITATVAVNANVKYIRVYAGVQNANCTVKLKNHFGVAIMKSEITADSATADKVVTFAISEPSNVDYTVELECVGADGMITMPALAVLGNVPTATVVMSKKENMGSQSDNVNLTEKGTIDWLYINYENAPDSKNVANHVISQFNEIIWDGGSGIGYWDHRVVFGWTDGTTNAHALIDNDLANSNQTTFTVNGVAMGTNNGRQSSGYSFNVTVKAGTCKIYVYMTGYKATTNVNVKDAEGTVIVDDMICEASGGSRAFELTFDVSAQEDTVLTFHLYKSQGENIGLAAIAVGE